MGNKNAKYKQSYTHPLANVSVCTFVRAVCGALAIVRKCALVYVS